MIYLETALRKDMFLEARYRYNNSNRFCNDFSNLKHIAPITEPIWIPLALANNYFKAANDSQEFTILPTSGSTYNSATMSPQIRHFVSNSGDFVTCKVGKSDNIVEFTMGKGCIFQPNNFLLGVFVKIQPKEFSESYKGVEIVDSCVAINPSILTGETLVDKFIKNKLFPTFCSLGYNVFFTDELTYLNFWDHPQAPLNKDYQEEIEKVILQYLDNVQAL